ncbi:hypothetical protein RM704_13375 [Streptomyces sp. DSM 3412]|uniref:Uncharacterized protein n=1 Tax=Streptomyces gottesmaniae TaxID=3075518 RepID=A0ABU2YVU6_9ACTN|nr:hypothetical protein [Streptomyces sp. DSM 3412]MDT0568450.1 hypothetical protein [Streptomyces sp. DSM 3412]
MPTDARGVETRVLGLPTLLLDADATSQSSYDWFKVAQATSFETPANLIVER